jgi:hypothetical protein
MQVEIKDPKTGRVKKVQFRDLLNVKVPLISLDGTPENGILLTRVLWLVLISTPFFIFFSILMALRIIPKSWAPEVVGVVTTLTTWIMIGVRISIIIGFLYILSFLFRPIPYPY